MYMYVHVHMYSTVNGVTVNLYEFKAVIILYISETAWQPTNHQVDWHQSSITRNSDQLKLIHNNAIKINKDLHV